MALRLLTRRSRAPAQVLGSVGAALALMLPLGCGGHPYPGAWGTEDMSFHVDTSFCGVRATPDRSDRVDVTAVSAAFNVATAGASLPPTSDPAQHLRNGVRLDVWDGGTQGIVDHQHSVVMRAGVVFAPGQAQGRVGWSVVAGGGEANVNTVGDGRPWEIGEATVPRGTDFTVTIALDKETGKATLSVDTVGGARYVHDVSRLTVGSHAALKDLLQPKWFSAGNFSPNGPQASSMSDVAVFAGRRRVPLTIDMQPSRPDDGPSCWPLATPGSGVVQITHAPASAQFPGLPTNFRSTGRFSVPLQVATPSSPNTPGG